MIYKKEYIEFIKLYFERFGVTVKEITVELSNACCLISEIFGDFNKNSDGAKVVKMDGGDAIKLIGLAVMMFAAATMQNNAIAGLETPDTSSKKVMLYQVCFKPTDKSKITCEPEKLVIGQAAKRCAELLKKFDNCTIIDV